MTTAPEIEHGEDRQAWDELLPGTQVVLVKLAPDGSEAARYPGTVVSRRDPGNWVVTRSEWTYRQIDLDELSFVPADILLEWFSPDFPFNAFATFSKTGEFRGWYANVAHPARLGAPNAASAEPALIWHDLYLDLVGLPDGRWSLRDEDELREARLDELDPQLLDLIQNAAAELQRRFITAELPFVREDQLRALLDNREIHSNRD